MKSRFSILIVAAILLGFTTPYDEDRAELDTLIPRMISLLEEEKIVDFLKMAVCESQKSIIEKVGIEKLAVGFAGRKKDALLGVLKMIKDQTPSYSSDGAEATYKFEKTVGNKSRIVFLKEQNVWCIKN